MQFVLQASAHEIFVCKVYCEGSDVLIRRHWGGGLLAFEVLLCRAAMCTDGNRRSPSCRSIWALIHGCWSFICRALWFIRHVEKRYVSSERFFFPIKWVSMFAHFPHYFPHRHLAWDLFEMAKSTLLHFRFLHPIFLIYFGFIWKASSESLYLRLRNTYSTTLSFALIHLFASF